jgi:hypothetical protein
LNSRRADDDLTAQTFPLDSPTKEELDAWWAAFH